MPDGESFLALELEQEIRGGKLTLVRTWPMLLERDELAAGATPPWTNLD
jgi:hypothetical protein